jgi:hypothetical protein
MPGQKTFVTLVYIGDGYLAAAEYGMQDESYFRDLEGEEGFELVHATLGQPLAKKVVRQGTRDQWFPDGYEAASAVAKHLSARRRPAKRRRRKNRW